METCYRIISENIAHQRIDGEVIVIHFDTGNYYSLNGSAAELWQLLEQPRSVGSLSRCFVGTDVESERALKSFLDELAGEGLLECIDGSSVRSRPNAPIPFTPPVLEKYSDMQHLLLADPLHDVKEEGWPKVKS